MGVGISGRAAPAPGGILIIGGAFGIPGGTICAGTPGGAIGLAINGC